MKRILSALLIFLFVLSLFPFSSLAEDKSTQSSTYNVDAALKYAKSNYNNYPGGSRCSEFVMDCLNAGGLSDVYYANGSYTKSRDTGTLYRYLVSKGFEIEYYYASNGNLATISGEGKNWSSSISYGAVADPGDCIFYFGDNEANPQHFVICYKSGSSSSYDRVYSVTPAYDNTVRYYGPGTGKTRYIAVFHISASTNNSNKNSPPSAPKQSTSGSVTLNDNKNEINISNAILYATINNPSLAEITTCGIYVYKDNQVIRWKSETVSSSYKKASSVQMWYDLNKELGLKLSANTSYNYEMFSYIGGVKYSAKGTFTTIAANSNDRATVSLDKSKNSINTTNAVLYANVNNPSKLLITDCGIFVMKDNEVIASKKETVSSSYKNASSVQMWYDLTKELGLKLVSKNTYSYVMYSVVDGKMYFSDNATFKTK